MGNYLTRNTRMEENTFVEGQDIHDTNESIYLVQNTETIETDGSDLVQQESNDMQQESNDIQQESNDMQQESNDMQQESNDMQQESNDIQQESNDMQQEYHQEKFVHPLIELLNKYPNEQQLIENMNAFCGSTFLGMSEETGEPVYEMVDQLDCMYPMLMILYYSVRNSYKNAVIWILENYLPIQVSHSDNDFFKVAIHKNNFEIAELLLNHPSFEPSIQVLKTSLANNRFDFIRKCLENPNLPKSIAFYKSTILNNLDAGNKEKINAILDKIQELLSI